MSDYKEDLCIYDPQNPLSNANPEHGYPTDDDPEPRKNCSCDNCFYGRDKLALRIQELEKQVERVKELPDEWEQQDREAQWPEDVPNGSQCADDLRKAIKGEECQRDINIIGIVTRRIGISR